MVEGQVFNGLYGCHWDCTEKVREQEMRLAPVLERPPIQQAVEEAFEEAGELLRKLRAEITQAESPLEQIRARRIALTPEYEGDWHAELYDEEAAPKFRAEGSSPQEAVAAVLRLANGDLTRRLEKAEGGRA
ncbi:hypothetical protein [Pseudomonas aeruginosa]|uniref:hypothetical protein n=1 Tax=Pseudomonas aeruginosa TaxID=287 RepID=UPI00383ABC8F